MSETSPDPWPNLSPVVDGIVPVVEVPQEPDLLSVDDVDTDLEMED
jgi:hypothetical protein